MKIRPVDLWPLTLITMFIVGIFGAGITGDVRWLALAVIPGAIFAKWWRV
jgi:hypothetical protein